VGQSVVVMVESRTCRFLDDDECTPVVFLPLCSRTQGLDNAISVSVAHPVWQRTKPNDEMDGHTGWVFRSSKVSGGRGEEGLASVI
jgi:hypothetical protein